MVRTSVRLFLILCLIVLTQFGALTQTRMPQLKFTTAL